MGLGVSTSNVNEINEGFNNNKYNMKKQPPRWVDKLLDWYCSERYASEIRGDLLELFDRWAEEKGLRRAKLLYVTNGLLFLRMYNTRLRKTQIKTNQMTMFSHYLKVAGRNMARYKTYTLANILGLTIGMAVCLLIFQHVERELSYEKAYPKHDRIYRLSLTTWAKSAPTAAEALKDWLPEVEEVCRLTHFGGDLTVLNHNENYFSVDHTLFADQSAISMFDYQFVHGSPEVALTRPSTLVLTESLAQKIFASENPVGKTIEISGSGEFEITGVIRDLPKNSHIKAEALVSMETFKKYVSADWYNSKGWMALYSYVLFPNRAAAEQARAKLFDFDVSYRNIDESEIAEYKTDGVFSDIMPIADVHLHSDRIQEMEANSSIVYVYIFISLAVAIIIIACVNFINIFVAMSMRRIREIGMRKVIGARKGQLVQQFLGEAYTTTFVSALAALGLSMLALPFYNSLAGQAIEVSQLMQVKYLLFLGCTVVAVGLLAGAYPAFAVSSFSATRALSVKKEARAGISGFRKALVVFQFVLSLFIIICTVAVTHQMDFVKNMDLGFSSSHVVAVKTYGDFREELISKRESLFARLKENPAIEEVSVASNLMGDQLSVETFHLSSVDPGADYPAVNVLRVDENFLSTLDIKLLSGRMFEPKTDTGGVYIINKRLADMWGVDNPVGQMADLDTRGETGPIVGMIDDIHYYSLHRTVDPLLIVYKPWWTDYLLVKVNGQNVPETLAYLEGFVKEVSPTSLFHYRFLDDRIDALYSDEYNMFSFFRVFSVLAIIISCIGLLGLAAIEVQRRTKEIGIRKVLGASGNGILGLISRQFVVLVGVAVLVAVPLSYYAVGEWLANFQYHVSPGVLLYLLPSLGFVVLAFSMVWLQSLKAATANPSDSLRYE